MGFLATISTASKVINNFVEKSKGVGYLATFAQIRNATNDYASGSISLTRAIYYGEAAYVSALVGEIGTPAAGVATGIVLDAVPHLYDGWKKTFNDIYNDIYDDMLRGLNWPPR
jgi:hypothetical protein